MNRIKNWLSGLGVGSKLSIGVISVVMLIFVLSMTLIIKSYRDTLIENSKSLMMAELKSACKTISNEVNTMGNVVQSMATTIETVHLMERDDNIRFMKNYLHRFPFFLGTYVNYEPNADGKDHLYLDDNRYSKNGRFAPYYQFKDATKKDETVMTVTAEFDGEWYTEPKQNALEFIKKGRTDRDKSLLTITEPYIWDGVPMISIVYPLILDGEYKGVVGGDKSLAGIRQILMDLKPYETSSTFLATNNADLILTTLYGDTLDGKNIIKDVKGYKEEFYDFLRDHKTGTIEAVRPYDKKHVFYVFVYMEDLGWSAGMAVQKQEIIAPINALIWKISIGVGLALILCVVFIVLFARRIIVRPVNSIMDLFGEIGMGNFDARVSIDQKDELGIMAENLNAMLDTTTSLIQSQEERDEMQNSVMKLLDEISALTDGDLTVRAEVTENMTGAIADSFNLMAEQLSIIVKNVQETAMQVGQTSDEVQVSTEKLAQTSTTQADQIKGTVLAIDEMDRALQGVAENALKSSGVSEESANSAKEGALAVYDTNRAIHSIRENVQETAQAIKRLGESSQEIGNIVQIINDIADRTSILALNASIQASMAGDAGRGFAVVAEEVQRLAERSTESTKQIETLVKNIQGEITDAGTSIDSSIQRVIEGTRLADDAHAKLEHIQKVSLELSGMIQTISEATREQAKTSEKISGDMQSIGAVSTETSKAGMETSTRMNMLQETATYLQESISAFKVEYDLKKSSDKAA